MSNLIKCEFCDGLLIDGKQKYAHFKRCKNYQHEGIDHLVCQECGYKSSVLSRHIQIHNLTPEEYYRKYPNASLVLQAVTKRRSESIKKKGGYKPTKSKRGAKFCEVCRKWYQPEDAKEHRKRCISDNPEYYEEGEDYIKCPDCNIPMLRLGKHLKEAHNWTDDDIKLASNEGLQLTAQCVIDKWKSKQDFQQVQNNREQTHLERYGFANPFSDPDVQNKIKQTNIRRYGVEHPMKDEDVFIRQNESAGNGPSELERFFDEHTCDSVVYTGYGGRFIRTKKGIYKYGRVFKDICPDFMVLPDNVLESATHRSEEKLKLDNTRHRTRYVVELLGDYYHSEEVIGISSDEHEREIKEAYASAGIECLVLWENDVFKRWDEIRPTVEEWVTKAVQDINKNPVWRKPTKNKVDGRKAMLECPYGSGYKFKTEKSLNRWINSPHNYWRPDFKEGRDYLICAECGGRFCKLTEHIRSTHGMTKADYRNKHGDVRLVATSISESVARSCSDKPRWHFHNSKNRQIPTRKE